MCNHALGADIMQTYESVTKITAEAEQTLWQQFYDLCEDGQTPSDAEALEALIRTLPVVVVRQGKTFDRAETYDEVIAIAPTVKTSTVFQGSTTVSREEPRFIWIAICRGATWTEACMADEHGIREFEHMQHA
jgi:hypothetical protein